MLRKFFPTFRFSSGKLFMWSKDKKNPKIISTPQKISRISCGPNHNAAVGQSGNLYTFGQGKQGQLGHGANQNVKEPKLVDYFHKNNIKVKDALCGNNHTIVLTEDGKVYTFGWGGRNINFLFKLFVNPVGPLGHGSTNSHNLPHIVKILEKDKLKIDRISAGKYFNLALTETGDVYQWGKGQYGVFGDGNNKNFTSPVLNQYFQYLKVQQLLKIKKMKSCESFSMALMNDNKLYGWGSNQSGQMGIKSQIGIEIYETVNFVTQIIREGYENNKVINFDVSQDTLIFETDNGQLWWSGMRIAYKPEKVQLPEAVKPKLFTAGRKSFAIITEDNYIYSKNGFVIANQSIEDINTGIEKIDGSKLFGGNIIGIGGQYQRRYAIIQ